MFWFYAMFGPGVPKSRFAWPLKSRVIDTSSGASWRFPELEGGSGMSPAAVGRNPDGRDSRQIVVLPSLLKTLVIDHKQHQKCVRPNFPAPDPIYSQSGLPSVEQKVTLSRENGYRNLSFLETNLKRINLNSGIKGCDLLMQKHLLHRPLSVGCWLVGWPD